MTIATILRTNHDILRHESELLIAHHLKKDRLWVLTHINDEISPALQKSIIRSFKRLKSGIPLAQIIGLKRFYDVDFIVNKYVLIPRQETEELIDLVGQELNSIASRSKTLYIADLGTGSGCIGLILAKKFPQHQIFLVDKSKQAIKIATQNRDKLRLGGEILIGDLLLPLKHCLPDVIVANLPYLNKKIYQTASLSVRKFEPRSALYGGYDGLDVYRRLFRQIRRYYQNRAYPRIWLEISPEQVSILKTEIPQFFKNAKAVFLKDLNNRYRFVHITFVGVDDNKD